MVRVLPDQIWEKDKERYSTGEPEPLGQKQSAAGREKQADRETNQEEGCGMLVFKPKAEEGSCSKQEFWFAEIDGAQEKVNRCHPKERLEGIHGEACSVAEDHGSKQDGKAGKEYGEAFAAEFAGNQTRDEDLPAFGECGQESDGMKRIAECEAADACEECDQGREIDVAPG